MRRFLLIALLWTSPCLGQDSDRSHERLRSEAARDLAGLNARFHTLLAPTPLDLQLREACARNCSAPGIQEALKQSWAEKSTAMDEVVSKMHRRIDQYIIATTDAAHPVSDSLKRALKEVLPKPVDGEPAAFVVKSGGQSSLIVAYTLRKGDSTGERATSVTIRAYTATPQGLELTDTTGENLDGYSRIAIQVLHPPVKDEFWVLVWGYLTGANGPNLRMRVYAYDARKFRTMWMPANVWGEFNVKVTDYGFTVQGPYYRRPGERRDSYYLFADGLSVEHGR